MDSSPTLLLMRYFWVQTNTSSTYIHQTGNLASYLWCADKKNVSLRRAHRVSKILPESKEICCKVHCFLRFPAVKSSKSVKTLYPL